MKNLISAVAATEAITRATADDIVADTAVPGKDRTCMGQCSLLTCRKQKDLDTVVHNRSMGTTHTTRSE